MRRMRVYEVTWEKDVAAWIVRRRSGRKLGPSHARKDDAVDNAVRRAKRCVRWWGKAQVVVHRKDGSFEFEHTYPRSADPKRSPS